MVGARLGKALTVVLLAAVPVIGVPAASAAPPPVPPCANPDTPSSALMQLPDFNYSVICLINEQRMMNGMKPLRPNGLLHDAAFIYVTSMLSGEFFTHHGG